MPRSKLACAPSSPPLPTVADPSLSPETSQTAMAIFVPPKSSPSTTGESHTTACLMGSCLPDGSCLRDGGICVTGGCQRDGGAAICLVGSGAAHPCANDLGQYPN